MSISTRRSKSRSVNSIFPTRGDICRAAIGNNRITQPIHYYENLDELFTEAYDRAIERFCEQRERAIAGITDPRERLATAIRMAIPSGPDDAEIRLLYELEPVAFRDSACAALMYAYIERQVAMYAAILEVGAATAVFALAHDARTLARNIVALEDGQGLYVLIGRDSPEEVERRILEYVAAATEPRRSPAPRRPRSPAGRP